jgi:hypothetical protein
MKLTLVRRIGALTIAGVLAVTGTGVSAGAAQAAPEDAAAHWLAKQLDRGLVHNDQFDFDDYGLTADVGLALVAIQGRSGEATTVARALARHVESWTTGVDFGSSDVYGGATAKAVVLAQAVGRDPRSFGGVNLVNQLNRRISSAKPTVGRLQDKSSTDYANTIGQALAVQGLARAGSPKAGPALRFLLKQQCSQGYFRLNFAADKSAVEQGCDAGSRSASAPDTDATALALQSLETLRNPSRKVRAAITDGTAWLKRKQKANGSLGGGRSTTESNSNSTGLAASALAGAGACDAARRAARWVSRLQVTGKVAGTPLAGEKGAIAYARQPLRDAAAHGIGTEQRDQWRRATAQAAPALAFLSAKACRG